MKKMFLKYLISVLILCNVNVYGDGPVYINPNQPPSPAPVEEIEPTVTPTQVDSGLVTQTVYGFLDFTTTIGNTVMIFSPQSAPPAPEIPKPTVSSKVVVNVIETSPSQTIGNSVIKPSEIAPTKTATKEVKQLKISSIVEVIAASSVVNAEQTPKIENVIVSKTNDVTNVKKSSEKKKISTKPTSATIIESKPPMIIKPISTVESSPVFNSKQILSSIVEVRTDSDPEPVLQIGNNIGEPEYDFLSRQPSEFAEETYKVINLKPTVKAHQNRNNKATHSKINPTAINNKDVSHPTGLVTKLTGTVVKDGITTVHETSVLGTYISGKYAQVLQSASQVFKNANKPRISPSSTLRILKTAAPAAPISRHHNVDPTPSSLESAGPIPPVESHNVGPNLVRSTRRPSTPSGNFKNRFRNRNGKDDLDLNVHSKDSVPQTTTQSSFSPKKSTSRPRNKPKTSRRYSRNFSTSTVELATVSVYSQLSTPSYSSRRHKSSRNGVSFKSSTIVTAAPPTEATTIRRSGFKPKVQPSVVDSDQSTSVYKFKLNRAPGRWQYKTSPKPRVTIRKSNSDQELTSPTSPATNNPDLITNDIPSASSRSDDVDLEQSGSINGPVLNDNGDNGIERRYPIETINVEISTPADFKDTYYEIATIKTPYTFQAGSVKNTRYITVTSTFEKTIEPEPTASSTLSGPLTENILASTTQPFERESNFLDTSIATLPPLYLSSENETPPLETLTETFSTTQTMLKTHILPVIREGANSSSMTLVQTYHITRVVIATKTLPPSDAYQFVPSKRLKEFNSKLDEAGSELHLELDFGDETDDEDVQPIRQLPPDLDLANIGSDFDLPDLDKQRTEESRTKPKKGAPKLQNTSNSQQQNLLQPDQLQQLALLRLLNPAAAAQLPQVLTTSKPVIKLETIYESHVIPITNGLSTSYSTISRPIGTVSKTEFEIETSTLPALPIPPVNPLFPQPQPQFQITTAPLITQTIVTQTQSKILKLTFGAKTAYTTLFSTNVVPTILTTYITTSVPVQPTAAAFPGFFPAPYAPYPYVG